MTETRSELLKIIEARALKRGTFTLASGRTASFYLDAKQVVLNSHGAMLVGKAILERLQSFGELPDAIGGMSIGADPITGAAVTIAGTAGLPLKGFMVRKEPKGHGAGNQVEGRFGLPDGAKVCMLEDTVTTGGSLLKAIHAVESAGLEVVQIICVVDRSEGAAERFAESGYTLEALATREDII